ncbi:uncharacterized protein LOC126669919 [Mercurialis annua]|uniref:uncharacterized protein LOC126669919 n=1 Tax=Mercurialis annua TaxID=3986 RepID=UPI00215F84F4|nr:uncharacterized protein LOC126669919 [Mercurialis annua]
MMISRRGRDNCRHLLCHFFYNSLFFICIISLHTSCSTKCLNGFSARGKHKTKGQPSSFVSASSRTAIRSSTGVSFGLTLDLFRFWARCKFVTFLYVMYIDS